jgi:hypothetical protein
MTKTSSWMSSWSSSSDCLALRGVWYLFTIIITKQKGWSEQLSFDGPMIQSQYSGRAAFPELNSTSRKTDLVLWWKRNCQKTDYTLATLMLILKLLRARFAKRHNWSIRATIFRKCVVHHEWALVGRDLATLVIGSDSASTWYAFSCSVKTIHEVIGLVVVCVPIEIAKLSCEHFRAFAQVAFTSWPIYDVQRTREKLLRGWINCVFWRILPSIVLVLT